MIYFKVPSNIQVINRLLELLKLSDNYEYLSEKNIIKTNNHNVTLKAIGDLIHQMSSAAQTEVQTEVPYRNMSSMSVAQAKFAQEHKGCKVKRIIIDYETVTVKIVGASTGLNSLDQAVLDVLNSSRTSPPETSTTLTDEFLQSLSEALGVSEEELKEAGTTIQEVMDYLKPLNVVNIFNKNTKVK